jgi:hypothetical protein
VFVREDLSDEQRLFGQTAAEFMQKEVLPVVQRLYEHDWALTRAAAEEGERARSAAARDSAGLRRPRASI